MEILILAGLALWAFFALRSCIRRKGSCCGNCAGCAGCGNRCSQKRPENTPEK